MTSQPILAWHFLRNNRCLAYSPHTLVEVGQTLEALEQPLQLCSYGLHASARAIDALGYAPGPIACRVELSGEILHGSDKLCATHRKCVAMADATRILHEFACWCAEQAFAMERAAGREPDARSIAAVEAKRAWLAGSITDQELAVAWAAAREAASDAARAAACAAAREAAMEAACAAACAAAREAAREAARAAALGAAWGAAWGAARAAALGAAWGAAWGAARAAAWGAARAAAWGAARDAACGAAWGAAREAQNVELERMLLDEMEAGE